MPVLQKGGRAMTLSRDAVGRIDLSEAFLYDFFELELASGAKVRCYVDMMGAHRVLCIDKEPTDSRVVDYLDRHTYNAVHRAKRTLWRRLRARLGLLVEPTLDQVGERAVYVIPLDRFREQFDRTPKAGGRLYVTPHHPDAIVLGCDLGEIVSTTLS